MLNLHINVTGDGAQLPAKLIRATSPAATANIVGRSGRNTIRDHLFAYNASKPNKLGGRRTNFYTRAARSTRFTTTANGADIIITHTGVRIHYYGGTITAGQNGSGKKFLTIPIDPSAHGKRASEFKDLRLIPSHTKGVFLLARTYKTQSPKPLFLLKRSVKIPADPAILPTNDTILTAAAAEIQNHINTLTQ